MQMFSLVSWSQVVSKTSTGRFGKGHWVSTSLENIFHDRDDSTKACCTDASHFWLATVIWQIVLSVTRQPRRHQDRTCWTCSDMANERALNLNETTRCLTETGTCKSCIERH